MHWGKQNVSNALNSTESDIFTVCHGGSIWSMINIKGYLNMHKLVGLCKINLSFMEPID